MADYTLNYSGEEIDAILALVSPHIEDTNNPHEVTKSQVGLGNVDNTSDLNKPLSTAMIAALALKAANSDLTNEAALRLAADAALGVRIDNLSLGGRFLSGWDATTGLATSNPSVSPYSYRDGDYFVVSKVGATNYKPDGSSYVIGQASTVQETGTIKVGYFYKYDGTNWNIIPLEIKDIVWGNIGGTLTDQNDLAAALNAKENKSNKKTSLTNSDTDYPTCNAVRAYKPYMGAIPKSIGTLMWGLGVGQKIDFLNLPEETEVTPAEVQQLKDFLQNTDIVMCQANYDAEDDEDIAIGTKKTNVTLGVDMSYTGSLTLYFDTEYRYTFDATDGEEDTLEITRVASYESQANRENTLSNSTTKYPTSHAVKAVTDEKVAISDISTSITSQSTNSEVAGAKAVWDLVNTRMGGKTISVVSELPATPDANTIYLITE